jgi:hypothetical protein
MPLAKVDVSLAARSKFAFDARRRRSFAAMNVRTSMLIVIRPGRRRPSVAANPQPAQRPARSRNAVSSDAWSQAVVWSVNAALERDEPVLAAELAQQSRAVAA